MFEMTMLMEMYRGSQKKLHCVSVDLDKAYDRLLGEKLWLCMKESGVAEGILDWCRIKYKSIMTVVRCAIVCAGQKRNVSQSQQDRIHLYE